MKLIIKNSKVIFQEHQETFVKYGLSDAQIEAFSSSYNVDAVFRGLNYGDRRTSKIRWYMTSANTVKIGKGVINTTMQDVATVEGVVGWNEYTFDEPLAATTKILLNGKGIVYVLSNAKPSIGASYYPLDNNNAENLVKQGGEATGTTPGIQLFLEEVTP